MIIEVKGSFRIIYIIVGTTKLIVSVKIQLSKNLLQQGFDRKRKMFIVPRGETRPAASASVSAPADQ